MIQHGIKCHVVIEIIKTSVLVVPVPHAIHVNLDLPACLLVQALQVGPWVQTGHVHPLVLYFLFHLAFLSKQYKRCIQINL